MSNQLTIYAPEYLIHNLLKTISDPTTKSVQTHLWAEVNPHSIATAMRLAGYHCRVLEYMTRVSPRDKSKPEYDALTFDLLISKQPLL